MSRKLIFGKWPFLIFFFIIFVWCMSAILIIHNTADWNIRSNLFGVLNSFFSVLVLAGAIYTIYLQRKELSLQREELKNQREELSTTAATQLRYLHIELLKMSMSDKDLAVVWDEKEGSNLKEFKRTAFINLILSHWQMLFERNIINDSQLKVLMQRHFANPHFIKFWADSRQLRKESIPKNDIKGNKFHQFAEAAFELNIKKS